MEGHVARLLVVGVIWHLLVVVVHVVCRTAHLDGQTRAKIRGGNLDGQRVQRVNKFPTKPNQSSPGQQTPLY